MPKSLGGTRTLPLCKEHHGLIHSAGQPLSLGRLSRLARSQVPLRWPCDVCLNLIEAGEGFLQITSSAIAEYERQLERWRSEGFTYNGGMLFVDHTTKPKAPPWRQSHFGCAFRVELNNRHWIPVDRVGSLEGFVVWVAEIAQEPWFAYCDWQALVAQVEGQLRS